MRNKNRIRGKDMGGDLGKESKEYSYRRITKFLISKIREISCTYKKKSHLQKKVNSLLGDSHHWRMPLVTTVSTVPVLLFPMIRLR